MYQTRVSPPTVLIFGMPQAPNILAELTEHLQLGLVVDNGYARDPIFTFYENLARADVILAFPNAHPVHLVSVLAEGEVGHPLILQGLVEKEGDQKHFPVKPVIFYGSESDWLPFREQFSSMRELSLMRDGFDRIAHYCSTMEQLLRYIEQSLAKELPATRLHYYHHSKKQADLSTQTATDVRPPSDITVSFFGSASSPHADVLERAELAAHMCARNDWNILHGGGDAGVMGQLSTTGRKVKAYVYGISVDFSGAPKIYFERKDDSGKLDSVDHYVASKDMLHRIETYALYSEGFVALDGGIGSLQEVIVIAELLAARHPAVMFQTTDGTTVPKPLLLQNEGGVYSSALSYLSDRGLNRLLDQIQVVSSTKELEEQLAEYFSTHRPLPRATRPQGELREQYRQVELPHFDITQELPRLVERGIALQKKQPILESIEISKI